MKDSNLMVMDLPANGALGCFEDQQA